MDSKKLHDQLRLKTSELQIAHDAKKRENLQDQIQIIKYRIEISRIRELISILQNKKN
jgi:hypothetical protein